MLSVPLELADGEPADKVVANIPYNITGPLLDRLIGRLDRPVDPPINDWFCWFSMRLLNAFVPGLGTAISVP